MPRPENLHELCDLIRQSRLIDPDRLEAFLAASPELEDSCRGTARLLSRIVGEGLLTPYQASEISTGRATSFHLGPYRILNALGRGGMGQVFLCEHGILGRQVAVKVLSINLQGDPGARRRFAREARAAAAVDHPNVVRVFDIEATLDPPYIVMEYVDGTSWQAAVARHGTFTPSEAAACGLQAAQGLQAIADAGLVHRDIKPANLLLDRNGGVKVLDLGIVHMAGEASLPFERGLKAILGTLDYLAPEQAVDSSRVDIRADLYALGSTLYFLLAGHPPFPDGEAQEKVSSKLASDPPRLDTLRTDLPTGLADVIHRLLARSPADRYQTPVEVAEALRPWAVPPMGFPDRFFARLTIPTTGKEPVTRTGDESGEVTPALATVKMVRPEVETAVRSLYEEFSVPATSPVRLADADFCKPETGPMTPLPPPQPVKPRRQPLLMITLVALAGLALLLAASMLIG